MRSLCRRYDLTEQWTNTALLPAAADRSDWVNHCRMAVHTQWTKRWRQHTAQHERLNGLYNADRTPRPQPYLYVPCGSRIGREVFVQTRSRTLPLGELRAALLADARTAARSTGHTRAATDTRTHAHDSDAATGDADAGTRAEADALAVTDAHIARAALCDVCMAHGQQHADTRQHFIAECDAQRFRQFVHITARQLHRAVHVARPEHAARCGAARDIVACVGPHKCAGSAVERNFRAASAEDVISACLNGYAPWIIAGADLRKDEIYRLMVQAIIRTFQNFLLLRWNERTRKLGFKPVIAFAPKNFGRQVMHTTDKKFIFALPTPCAPASASAPACSAVSVGSSGPALSSLSAAISHHCDSPSSAASAAAEQEAQQPSPVTAAPGRFGWGQLPPSFPYYLDPHSVS
jgi:hypothetical protein